MKLTQSQTVILGMLAANASGMLLIGISKFIVSQLDGLSGFFVFSDFIIVPGLMGIICAYLWRNLALGGAAYTGFSIINSTLAIGFSYFFLSEGYICLIIVCPLIMGLNIAGVFIGKVMFKRNKNTMSVSIISILLIVMAQDVLSEHTYQNKVTDIIIVNAPPEKVWQYVVAYEPIREKENYWLFKVGMPSPIQSIVDGYCEGAGRKCIFSNGYTFDEKMTVFKPSKELTFEIINQPKDPEIMGHIEIVRGQFLLKDNGDGTTTLTGNSWYNLHVFPIWYFDFWASQITRNVHLRVMDHIKKLSERNV
jgi:hypothetical protein